MEIREAAEQKRLEEVTT
ncbi:hypothetical protein [Pyrobaculum sp.]